MNISSKKHWASITIEIITMETHRYHHHGNTLRSSPWNHIEIITMETYRDHHHGNTLRSSPWKHIEIITMETHWDHPHGITSRSSPWKCIHVFINGINICTLFIHFLTCHYQEHEFCNLLPDTKMFSHFSLHSFERISVQKTFISLIMQVLLKTSCYKLSCYLCWSENLIVIFYQTIEL